MDAKEPIADKGDLDRAYRRLVRSQLDPGLGIVTAVAVGLFALTGMLPVVGGSASSALFSGLTVVGLWAALALRAHGRRERRGEDFDLLIAAGDPRVVAPLLEELRFHCARYEGPEADALIRLLPGVSSNDPLFRYRWYQEALHHALRETADPRVLVPLLGLIGRVGDGRGIGYVRMLAENAGHFVRDDRVAEAARSALPSLRRRLGYRIPEPQLLRAASSPSSEPENMVRPAPSAAGGEHLIRPSDAA
jgi:hypothetical protein